MKLCLQCLVKLKPYQGKYCSNKCQSDFQYKNYISAWKAGLSDGTRGIVTKNISQHLKRYVLEMYGEQCSICAWKERHPVSNKVPLEIDHQDGNSENNKEQNLRLLCPNCHSLTSTFRNLNVGRGRLWRKSKYIKNKA